MSFRSLCLVVARIPQTIPDSRIEGTLLYNIPGLLKKFVCIYSKSGGIATTPTDVSQRIHNPNNKINTNQRIKASLSSNLDEPILKAMRIRQRPEKDTTSPRLNSPRSKTCRNRNKTTSTYASRHFSTLASGIASFYNANVNRQQNLFQDAADLKWSEADLRDRLVAQVVFNRPMETGYHYLVPDPLREMLRPGQRVKAPLGRGNKVEVGFCIDLQHGIPPELSGKRKLKEIVEILDREPLVNRKMLDLTRWIASYYLCSWGQVLHSVIPAAVKKNAGTREYRLFRIAEGIQDRLDDWQLPAKQRAVIEVLKAAGEPMLIDALTAAAKCGTSPVNSLRKKGIIEAIRETRLTFSPEKIRVEREEALSLSRDQQRALDAIIEAADRKTSSHETLLLHGVTGSGKTEVYIRAIRHIVDRDQQAILLVPEISLTPQTIRRFSRRFDSVAVLHSHLTDSERHWHWQQIASGNVQVVVGARSAVFAPMPNLGMIIIDEEHETTFKQETVPRYHAREVARKRAIMEEIPLILGTATPTLESWSKAKSKKYRLISLPERIEKLPMPPVVVVDTVNDPLIKRGHNIGRALRTSMDLALKDNGQIILFFNLRGFTPVLWCRQCGETFCCPHCATSLTWHKDKKICLCHTCDYKTTLPDVCPRCNQPGLRHFGSGTQRLEDEVRGKFPGVSVIRMDSDSMRKPGSHDEALEKFRHGEVSILLGTQMIAKGLDFPNVTLVGVVNADTSLHQVDFRASERTFQLISQVAGRTGRSSRGGRVLVQTMQPDAEAIRFAAEHDYVGFAEQELKHRQERQMPPHFELLRIIIRGTDEKQVEQSSIKMGDILREESQKLSAPFRILGPGPAPLARLKNYYRFNILLGSQNHAALCELIETCRKSINKIPHIEYAIDVDPIHMR